MTDQQLLGITTYVQLLDVMEKLCGELAKDIEATERKVPILKQNLIRAQQALLILQNPARQRRGGGSNSEWWTPERRAAQAERVRVRNLHAKREREAVAGPAP